MCVLPFMIINLLNTIIILAKRGWTNYALATKLSKKYDVVHGCSVIREQMQEV